jgi:hypothetical protein
VRRHHLQQVEKMASHFGETVSQMLELYYLKRLNQPSY